MARRKWAARMVSALGAGLLAAAAGMAPAVVAASPTTVVCPSVEQQNPYTVSPAPTPGVDWAGCDLSYGDLSNGDLSGANLTGATMVETDLVGADLGQVTAAGADLSSAYLDNADLTDALLTGAELSGATLTGANLSGTGLGDADLSYVSSGGIAGAPAELPANWALTSGYLLGPETDLAFADLSGLDLDGDVLTQAVLDGTNLTGATATAANLTHADLDNADLTSANLSDADLTSANLRDSVLTGTVLTGAQLAGIYNGGITGVPAALPADWQLLGGSFGYLIGPGADLQAVDLTGADLAGADLAGADIAYSLLPGVNLTGADLAGASIYRANLHRAKLVSANLDNADLTITDLTDSSLDGATVTGTVWTGAWWSNTICPNGLNSNKYLAGCFSTLDTTPPVAAPYVPAIPSRASWYTQPVAVIWNWTDNGTIVQRKCQSATTVRTSGDPVTVRATCTDLAGNVGHASYRLKVDLTRPLVKVTGVRNGATYASGHVPKAGCSTTDPISGVLVRARLRITGRHKHGLGKFVATCSGAVSVAGAYQSAPVRVSYTVDAKAARQSDEVDVIEDGSASRIVGADTSTTRGQRLVRAMRGRATTSMSTDQLLELLRAE
jgi:uncharacterized protein YjbI with pentapeptide repeats